MYCLRHAQHIVFRDRGDPLRVLLVVVVRQALHPQARQRAVDAADRRERAGSRWISESFATLSSSSVTGLAPRMPRSSFMNSTSAASVLSVDDVAAGAERARALAKREARAHAVAVALLLADVGVQPRLEHAAEHGVHHLQRVVVGRVARRPRLADRERRLRRARLVDEVDRRRPCGSATGGIRERRLLAARRPGRQRLFDHGLRRSRP